MTRLNIAVIGAGAMGSLYAALLAPHAHVTILDGWAEQVGAIRSHGLTLTGISGVRRPELRALTFAQAAAADGWADAVIAVVNAGDSTTAALVAKSVLRSDGYVLTLQNGVGNIEAYQRVLSPSRVLAGLSYHSAVIRGLAEVEHTHQGPTWIGEIDGQMTDRLYELALLMNAAGGQPKAVDNIVSVVWTKLVHNCAINAICALAGLRVGEIPLTPGADDLQTKVIEEAIRVVRAKGIALADPDLMASIKRFCTIKFNKPSMLQHIEASRETEIEALNGAIVREGEALGLATPYNQAVTWMVESLQDQRIRLRTEPPRDYAAMERLAKGVSA